MLKEEVDQIEEHYSETKVLLSQIAVGLFILETP